MALVSIQYASIESYFDCKDQPEHLTIINVALLFTSWYDTSWLISYRNMLLWCMLPWLVRASLVQSVIIEDQCTYSPCQAWQLMLTLHSAPWSIMILTSSKLDAGRWCCTWLLRRLYPTWWKLLASWAHASKLWSLTSDIDWWASWTDSLLALSRVTGVCNLTDE